MFWCSIGMNHCGLLYWMLIGLAAPGFAATDRHISPIGDGAAGPVSPGRQTLDFLIPALPLETALDRYAAISLVPTLFSSEIVAGRFSTEVRGRYTPQAALDVLLTSTGLMAQTVGQGSKAVFVLKRAPDDVVRGQKHKIDSWRTSGFPALLQARVLAALCGDNRTVPGNYRALLRFRVDVEGEIWNVQLLGSTGDDQRDRLLPVTLNHIKLNQTPPRQMLQQPLTVAILPNRGLRCHTEIRD
ncbi:hypothetical protein EZJ58_5039 [Sodalis ligni]|uniref:Secretin/TonB short N-terminal domain-containing protein n=2 Tax=Sodalis ligni TaxID=2697027 RepID=A0A4R1NI78_9GAMM|nr:hypothetical protein EZJ58_5039 [Sodalis ligni]